MIFATHCAVPKINRHQAVCEEVIRRLREERKRHGFSNYVVAQRSGLSESSLSLIERGLRTPTLETLLKIAEALGTDLGTVIRHARAAVARQKSQ